MTPAPVGWTPTRSAAVLEAAGHRAGRRPRPAGLTTVRWRFCGCSRRGLSNKQIAARLVLSPRTAERHVQDCLRQDRGLSSRAGAALYAMEHGLLEKIWVDLRMRRRRWRARVPHDRRPRHRTVAPGRRLDRFTRPFVLPGGRRSGLLHRCRGGGLALPLYVTGRWARQGGRRSGLRRVRGVGAAAPPVRRPVVRHVWGRRPLLFGGALLAAAALGLTATGGLVWPMVVLLRLLVGVAEAAFFVASFAVLADLAPPDRMGEALSYNSLGLYLGLAFGPPLGELMVDTARFRDGLVRRRRAGRARRGDRARHR